MEDILRQATAILRATWKYRRLGMIFAWLIGAIAAGIILRIPDKYEATARISLDTQSILKPLMSGLAVQPNVEQKVLMLGRTLVSRPNVEKVIRMSDMDINIQSKANREELIDNVTKALEIKSTNRDNIYTVSYRNTDPAMAQTVVQSLISIFVESSVGDKREDSVAARKFIEEQISNSERKLQEAESRLKEFKLRNVELETADGKGSMDRLSEIAALLQKSRLELREAENSRDALRRQLAGDEVVLLPESPGADAGISLPEIDGRIDVQKRNLDTLLQKYTDKHPDVIGTRRLIKDLEEQKRQEILARRQFASANPGAGISNNPVYQQLKVSLGEAEATVASLRTRVTEYESRYKRTKEFMKFQPQLEAELVQLNRDYEIQRKNYEQLATRRESAVLTGNLDSAVGGADFRLIDPPRASSKPVAPNRLVLLPLGLLFAIAGGFLVAFAASQVRPVFFDGKSLRDETGLPVLGIVTLLPNEIRSLQERTSLTRFLLSGAALVSTYAAGIAILTYLSRTA
jgi:polysaccharide chain length determinant protein (PEP-CTERM system associated)